MSYLGLFPNARERRLAREEAAHALEQHGANAPTVLLMKARQSQSAERRLIYRLARKIVLKNA